MFLPHLEYIQKKKRLGSKIIWEHGLGLLYHVIASLLSLLAVSISNQTIMDEWVSAWISWIKGHL